MYLLSLLVFSIIVSGCEKIIEDKVQIAKKKPNEELNICGFDILMDVIIKGGFKECSVYEYKCNNGIIDSNSKYLKEHYKYDKTGNLIDKNLNNPYDTIPEKYIYKYDNIGNLIEETHSKKYDSIPYKCFYKYNNDGNLIEESSIFIDKFENPNMIFKNKFIFKYDINGNRIEEICFQNDKLVQTLNFKYNINGNLIEEAIYNKEHYLSTKKIYKYNSSGKIIEVACFDNKLNLSKKIMYKYNENRQIIEYAIVEFESINPPISYDTYFYNGYQKKEIYYDNNKTVKVKNKFK